MNKTLEELVLVVDNSVLLLKSAISHTQKLLQNDEVPQEVKEEASSQLEEMLSILSIYQYMSMIVEFLEEGEYDGMLEEIYAQEKESTIH